MLFSPKMDMVNGHSRDRSSRQTKTAKEEKNLPKTIEGRPTGEVSRSWSVFCLYSSEKTRMVRMGVKNIITIIMNPKTPESEEEELKALKRKKTKLRTRIYAPR
jgi:hypothetical protein